ncbi:MAG: chorismate lyase [Candidatus Sedimenticola sp. (ex Thyasira tokunagai)]
MDQAETYNPTREAPWAEWPHLRYTGVSGTVQSWLRDTGSLTARLKVASRGNFRVRLLNQGWERPLYSESRLLGMRAREIAVVREVELLCDGVPWVFARTLIPASSLTGAARQLTRLGERPLGEVLFTHRQMQRGVTEMARLTPRHRLFAEASGRLERRVESVWGRRTLFYLAGKPLLVNEIFLPDSLG